MVLLRSPNGRWATAFPSTSCCTVLISGGRLPSCPNSGGGALSSCGSFQLHAVPAARVEPVVETFPRDAEAVAQHVHIGQAHRVANDRVASRAARCSWCSRRGSPCRLEEAGIPRPARAVTSKKVVSRLKSFKLASTPKGVLNTKGRLKRTFRSWVALARLRQFRSMASPRFSALRKRRSRSPVKLDLAGYRHRVARPVCR